MNILTRKNALIALQLLTVLGILIGLVAGCCLLWEVTDMYMLNGRIYTFPVAEQAAVWQHAVDELTDEGIEYGLVAAGALAVSLLTGIVATVLACLTKTTPQH